VRSAPLRVALFPDSLREINGVANTCRHFAEYAQRNVLPMLVVHGSAPNGTHETGSVRYLGLRRGYVSLPLERDLRFDLLFARHLLRVQRELRHFQPDIVHVTGPSDMGMLGAIAAHRLKIPMVASWHTNIHEYLARRSDRALPRWILSGDRRSRILHALEREGFRLSLLFYKLAYFHFAPNLELVHQLQDATHRSCWLMERGIDLELFGPHKRTRNGDGEFLIGYVGRLSTEKKIRSFGPLANTLREAGLKQVRFVFVGHGSEEKWIRENLPSAQLTGVLRGEALSRAYANLDLFVFFSETDTFGNVVLEALASGVPAIVSKKGGPKFIVDSDCGIACANDLEFARAVLQLIQDDRLRRSMSEAGRRRAERASWNSVFDAVYRAYDNELRSIHERYLACTQA